MIDGAPAWNGIIHLFKNRHLKLHVLKELHEYEKEKYNVIHPVFDSFHGMGCDLLDVFCELVHTAFCMNANNVESFA
jgi:hypothetical protein